MKPSPVFLLLGPFLSWLYSIGCLYIVTYPGPVFEDERWWPASFMICFTFALLPMAVAALIDNKLSHLRWRSLVCFLAGFALASGLLLLLTLEDGTKEQMQRFSEVWWYVGAAWGLPAAICSWVVGMDHEDAVKGQAPSH